MPEMLKPSSAIMGAGLGHDVALITDGRFSGGSHGFLIGHIVPEAQEGGPIALVEDGDVIEIDAASNNGVDNIREIREEVAYRPTQGKYKVYIIDEVHMLSTGAFNALLKTLEEPPSYVIFILATTEAHKIPITILSRCQRYDFRRITIDTIAARLMELMEKEHIQAEEKAIRYIAKAADGSLRDALSLLDQCVAFYLGQTLTYDNVLDVLGTVDTEIFSGMLRQVAAGDVAAVIHLLEELVLQGKEMGQFVTDFTWYMRNLLLVKSSPDSGELLERVYEYDADGDSNSLEVIVGRLRRKIGAEMIETIRGRGYRLVCGAA